MSLTTIKPVATVLGAVSTLNRTVGKHSPLIFTGLGVVGLVATSYYAYKSAGKVEAIVEELEAAREDEERLAELTNLSIQPRVVLTEEELAQLQSLQETVVPVSRAKVFTKIAGAVALPVGLGVVSIAMFGTSYFIQNNRIANLAAALATAGAERLYYNKRFVDMYGEEKFKEFITPTQEVQVTEVNEEDGSETTTEKQQVEKRASINGAFFKDSAEYVKDDHAYNQQFIRSVESALELRLFRNGAMTLNEVYDALGMPRTRAGATIGWTAGDNFCLDQQVIMNPDKEYGRDIPEIYIIWTSPKYIYDSITYETRMPGIL